jgi:hypothetical protein
MDKDAMVRRKMQGSKPSRARTLSNDRPRGFTAVGIFFLFGATMAAYAAITLIKPGTALDGLWGLNRSAHAQLAPFGKAAGLGFALLSGLLCAASIGWLRRRSWGWALGTTIVAMNAAGDLANLAFGDRLKGAAGVVIAAALLFFMTRPGLRTYFKTQSASQ